MNLSKDSVHLFSSWVDVSLDAFAKNYEYIAQKVSPAGVIPVIKANGMGHGARILADTLTELGARIIGVSNFLEGLQLRDHGIKTPVIVFNGLTSGQIEEAVRQDLDFFGFDQSSLEKANEIARKLGKKARVHVKVDTGMGRLGFLPEEAPRMRDLLSSLEHLDIVGVASHLSSPYVSEHDPFSLMQLEKFKKAAEILDPEHKAMWHFSASSGTVRFDTSYLDSVRPGALLYGVSRVWPLPWDLVPVAEYKSTLVQVKRLPKGHNIGYKLHYTAPRDMLMGVVPVGTTDGLTSEHADKGVVLIRGKRCRIVGICSCEMMVDLTDIPEAKAEDEVVMFGYQGEDFISAVESAEIVGTSYANLLTKIPWRTPRVYWKNGRRVAVDVMGEVTK